MQEFVIKFKSILNGDFPPEDGYYLVHWMAGEFCTMWWDSKEKTWTFKKDNGVTYSPKENKMVWWSDEWEPKDVD